ncbi:MAG: HNH endonuclease [Bacteroidales bacterium]|nr:HNH endonuclease [Bacteroidales bacterium]
MIEICDYTQELKCEYRGETYQVRDNGAIMRLPQIGKNVRKKDYIWTFGDTPHNGYIYYCGVPVHRIVCTAFNGPAPTDQHVVDHIDTNRQNNRPENLRWLTKLENILNNEITRRKVELICGSITAFLENPQLLFGHEAENPNFSWMRAVTKEEAANTLANMQNWLHERSVSQSGTTGNWIFQKYEWNLPSEEFTMPSKASNIEKEHKTWKMSWEELEASLPQKDDSKTELEGIMNSAFDGFLKASPEPIVLNESKNTDSEEAKSDSSFLGREAYQDSLTPNVLQSVAWRTPTEFPLCPTDSTGGLDAYLENLQSGECFSKGRYCIAKVVKAAKGMYSDLIVYGEMFEADEPTQHSIKPYCICIVHMIGNQYAHDSYSTYFDADGAEKYYTILQGKEWTGGNVLDDWC